MIVCRECGTQNEDGDQFCGGCPAFLEWSGEHILEDRPAAAADEPSERDGIVARIKHVISGDALPPPSGPTSPTPDPSAGAADLAPPTPGDASAPPTGSSGDDRAAALVATPKADEPTADGSGVGARPPSAQLPQATKPRPPVRRQPPTRRIDPGDLVCGQCGEGNTPDRKFCRRCGDSLEKADVKKRPWYLRWLPRRKKKQGLRAGERPDRGASGRNAGRTARIFRGKALGKLADARRLLAILALLGIGVGFAIPSARSAILDGGGDVLGRVRRIVSPTFSKIAVDPARVSASSETEGNEASDATDDQRPTYWLAAEDDPRASVTVVFVEPTQLQHVLVHPGKQEPGGAVIRPDPRPRTLLFRITDEANTITEVSAALADEDGFQKVDLEVDAATQVETVIVDCFPDPAITVCPITDLEFQTKD